MKQLRVIAASLIFATACASMASAARISGDKVLAAVKANYNIVKDYKADMSMSMKRPGMSINNMKMTLYFKKPNKVRIETKEGANFVQPNNLMGNPVDEISRSGHAAYIRSEKKLGRNCHLLSLKTPSGPAKVWVDKSNNTITAVEATGQYAFKSAFRYVKIDGKYYLPSAITANMNTPSQDGRGTEKSSVSVTFSNYRVNKGISDKVFAQKSHSSNAASRRHK